MVRSPQCSARPKWMSLRTKIEQRGIFSDPRPLFHPTRKQILGPVLLISKRKRGSIRPCPIPITAPFIPPMMNIWPTCTRSIWNNSKAIRKCMRRHLHRDLKEATLNPRWISKKIGPGCSNLQDCSLYASVCSPSFWRSTL